jgi:oligopeptide/dipeptide ABC transporter ATP-binding protein
VTESGGSLDDRPLVLRLREPLGAIQMDVSPEDLYSVENVTRHFREDWRGRTVVHALDGVTINLRRGEAVGIVGESGSGKSTLVRLLALLDAPTAGRIRFHGSDLQQLSKEDLRRFRRRVQIIFQDPYSSLDPRYTAGQSIAEALRVHQMCPKRAEGERVRELLQHVGLSTRMADRHPREMSGGERQRVSIARALAVQPEVLLADEPVSSLDVSIQAQIIELLDELKREEHFTLVMVAHDLALVRETCDRVITLYLGQVVEDAPAEAYYRTQVHPYSYSLFRSAPDPERVGSLPDALALGEPPSAVTPPSGCRFHPRCFNARSRCAVEEPQLVNVGGQRRIACFYPVTDEHASGADSPVERPGPNVSSQWDPAA